MYFFLFFDKFMYKSFFFFLLWVLFFIIYLVNWEDVGREGVGG